VCQHCYKIKNILCICREDIIAPVPTQVLNNGIDSAPAPVLDLSLDSDLCVEEVIVPQHSQRQSLAQDSQAARLFTVKKNRGSLEVVTRVCIYYCLYYNTLYIILLLIL